LRSDDYFQKHDVEFTRGAELVSLDTKRKTATLSDGTSRTYEKLLLATGASPVIPLIKGLDQVRFHVLRTMDDALELRQAIGNAKRAVVLGAGLIGTHGAENLAKAGLKVTLIETQGQILPGYFDRDAAAIIENVFMRYGIELILGCGAREVRPGAVVLDDGRDLPFDLLMIGTGVRPALGYLKDSDIKIGRGILVDESMRTSAPDVWAAGDCAEVALFQTEGNGIAGILPMAVEQGRIAGMGMAGDRSGKPFPGAVSINTYTFYGQQAISVGSGIAGPAPDGAENIVAADPMRNIYRRIVLKNGRLVGIAGINVPLDPGILWQMIVRRIDLTPIKASFLEDPLSTGRSLMSRRWR
jgi:phenylglyoxylate dehydrogenase epsilon subunit